MSRLARIKSAEEDHDWSNVVCEELKAKLKLNAHPVVTIGKLLQKYGSGKVGSYTWPICMVKLILEQLVNEIPTEAILPNIVSWADLYIPGVKFIVQEIPRITLSLSAGQLFELLVRNFWLIVLLRCRNGINYFLTARAGVILLSRIWTLASFMRNVCVSSYSQPPSYWS